MKKKKKKSKRSEGARHAMKVGFTSLAAIAGALAIYRELPGLLRYLKIRAM